LGTAKELKNKALSFFAVQEKRRMNDLKGNENGYFKGTNSRNGKARAS
jgi:hypothetical protein